MSMSQADFAEIAEAVQEAQRRIRYGRWDDPAQTEAAMAALATVTQELATACARRYKGGYGFKRQRFVEAAGFPEA